MQVHSETLICDKKKTRHRFWAWIIFSSLLGLLVAIALFIDLHGHMGYEEFPHMAFLWPSSIFLLATDGSEKSLGSFVIVSGAFLANAVLFGLVGALLWPLGRQIAKLLNLLKRPI